MFDLYFSTKDRFVVYIAGCPSNGIDAIDFRRSHGLPEDPDSCIDLGRTKFNFESVARKLPLTTEANFWFLQEWENMCDTIWPKPEEVDSWLVRPPCKPVRPTIDAQYIRGWLGAETDGEKAFAILGLWESAVMHLEAMAKAAGIKLAADVVKAEEKAADKLAKIAQYEADKATAERILGPKVKELQEEVERLQAQIGRLRFPEQATLYHCFYCGRELKRVLCEECYNEVDNQCVDQPE